MAGRSTRQRHIRRDRRKAKQSGFSRPGKSKMGKYFSHGATGSIVIQLPTKKKRRPRIKAKQGGDTR